MLRKGDRIMEKIVNKMESYHIFTFIIPGTLFLLLCKLVCGINIDENNLIMLLFMSYFVGIIISRIGSLIVGNILNYVFNVKLENYDNYISAEKKDEKIWILMKDGNMFRNLCTMTIIVLIIKIIMMLNLHKLLGNDALFLMAIILLIVLFSLSYVKQEKMIISRVKKASKRSK